MAVLRYFHQDPKQLAVRESSVVDNRGTTLTNKLTTINTSISNNTQAIDDKQDSIPGKSLSSNDFTNYYKDKLDHIEAKAEVNVQADWDENDSTADSYIQNKPGIDTVVTQDSDNLITSGAVFTAIDNLPEPMIFKGSLGVGGTIQSLPSASSSNIGYTYKVITDGTYAGQAAKAGDVFISDGTDWIYIPSADEPSGTVTNVAMTVPTGLEVSGSPITTSGTLAITYALGYAIPTLTDQAAWTAKQDAISDLATIRSRADEGHTAYGWGNHASAGYAYASALSGYLPLTGGTMTGNISIGNSTFYASGTNGGINSLALADDSILGDCNIGGHIGLKSLNTANAGISFYNSSGGHLGRFTVNSSGVPTWNDNTIWHTGNLTNLNQLTNGPGYITGINSTMVTNALGYTPANSSSLSSYLPLSGGTMSGNISFSNSGTGFRGINYGTMGDNDQWRIGGAATASNAGYMEIATADDGTEPIYVRQYTGVFSSLTRTATLLDESGNTGFPGIVSAARFYSTYNSYPQIRLTHTDNSEVSVYLENNTAGWAIGVNTWSVGAGGFAIGQYSGTGSSTWRFRIDNNGYCYTNSYLNIGGHEKNASSPPYVWGSNSSDNYLRSYQTAYLSVNYANSSGNADTVDGNHASAFSLAHATNFDFNVQHASNYVTFDKSSPAAAPAAGWYNGFVSTHNNYLSSYLINLHRSENWYVGYSENTIMNNWCLLLHHRNYSSYALPLSGGTLTGELTVRGNIHSYGNGGFSGCEFYHKTNHVGFTVDPDIPNSYGEIGSGSDYFILNANTNYPQVTLAYPNGGTFYVGPFGLTNKGYFNSNGVWVGPSDISLKRNIHKIEAYKSKYLYDWMVAEGIKEFTWKDRDVQSVGVIAQEVLDAAEDVVDRNEYDNVLYVDYTKLHSRMIAAIVQELEDTKEEIKLLRAQIAELKQLQK